ncbi:CRISPR-associated helicase/endonuclease Cas3 [Xylanibacter brevis]|uniref:CRISPR-associated helicase/endonuclease Cas3 n=1 Tax=Xylanibacter brevis TaxID=83231 RepID=UPI000488EAA8|nr:CRISPR-associated helicase/endonuclease Cas3 [Xylanibacter brevis]
MANKIIISHVRTPELEIQSNEDHSRGVAARAVSFAETFGMGDLGRIMGLLHDKGKEQSEWQKYIQGATGYNKDYTYIKKGPNHSYVGAVIAQKQYPQIAPLIAQPIAGHHRGLYDYCVYIEETKCDVPQDVTIDEPIPYQLPKFSKLERFDLHHTVRMLFSCLVDADSLDTEAFMNPEQARLRGGHATMPELLRMMENHLQQLKTNAPNTEVNSIRNYVQEQCIKESQGNSGFYSLTVPTGGGKTLASVLWALHHAAKNHLQRIIIAIPYTSIIVQTAATLKRIFGEDNVLEHHSNINPEEIKDKMLRERLQLATENWDYPIIVTTNVQFFESLFSNKRSDCRKLHNIAKSVVILDEVQTLPLDFYRPIVDTLNTLQRVFGASVLFTTASQPILSGRIESTNPQASFDALSSVHEIIPDSAKLHDKLRRVELQFMDGARSYDDIAEELSKHQQVLCIVNTRRDAKELYDRLPKEGICLHLSRMMCPAHVAATIEYIKTALKLQKNQPLRVVATQLIEAGVDIDFPVVFRQEAGLDSILQAAGRCNREGKSELCTTYVFSLGKEHPLPSGFMTQTNNARLNMGQQHDWFAPEAMTCYFKQLHSRVDNFDSKQMQEMLYKQECEFEEAARQFHLIDDQTTSVIINWKESMDLYEQLLSQGPSYDLMKKLAHYSVNIRKRDFDKLQSMGAVEEPFENLYAITNPSFYKADTGLIIDNQWLEETYII